MLPIKGLQLSRDSKGVWSVADRPGAPVITMEDHEPVFDWLEALGLPKDLAALEAMAHTEDLSKRHIRFVLADESVTTLQGSPRYQPRRWIYAQGGYALTLGHLGLVVGYIDDICPMQPGELPEGCVEGLALIAEATLYDSALAEAARRGIQSGIFGHVCPVIQQVTLPLMTGGTIERDDLLEVALIDRPACRNAKILKAWEG